MKLEVNITKTKQFIILGAIFLMGGLIFGYAYNNPTYNPTSPAATPNYKDKDAPPVFGHSADETNVRLSDGSVMTLQDAINQGKFGGSKTSTDVFSTNLNAVATYALPSFDLQITKPAGTKWKTFEVQYIAGLHSNGNSPPPSIVTFSYQTAPIIGTALTNGMNTGSGNSGQDFQIRNTGDDDEDGTVGIWFYKGNMPSGLENVDTVTIRASTSNVQQYQWYKIGYFTLKGTYE